MREISLQDAQNNLSSLIEHAMQGESTVITSDGQPQAIIIGIEEWNRYQNANTFGRLLVHSGLEDDDIPARNPCPLGTIEF